LVNRCVVEEALELAGWLLPLPKEEVDTAGQECQYNNNSHMTSSSCNMS